MQDRCSRPGRHPGRSAAVADAVSVLCADMANALAKTLPASGVRAESALLSRLSCYARLVVDEV